MNKKEDVSLYIDINVCFLKFILWNLNFLYSEFIIKNKKYILNYKK